MLSRGRTFVGSVASSSTAGALVIGAFTSACVARLIFGERLSVAETAAIVTAAALCIIARKASPAFTSGTAIAASFALVPVAILGDAMALSEPLATTHLRCGTGDLGVPLVAVLFVFIGCALAVPVVLLASVQRVQRALVVVGLAAVAAMAVVAGMALASLRRPEPDAYLDLFTERANIEPTGSVSLGGVLFTYSNVVESTRPDAGTCPLTLTYPDHVETQPIGAVAGPVCPRLRAFTDSVSNTIVVTELVAQSNEPSRVVLVLGPEARSLRSAAPGFRDITVDDLKARLGVPRMWGYGAAGGVLLAAAAMFAAWATRKRRAALRLATEGYHAGDGWVRVGEGAPRFAPELALASPGPVVVRDAASAKSPTYRSDGAPPHFSLLLGTRASLEAETIARSAAWACVALATAAMTSAPLWAARLHGLL